MKRLFFTLGLLFMGFGLFASFSAVLMILEDPSKFSLTMNVVGITVVGLLPLAIGVVLWLRSGKMRFGKTTWFLAGFALSWMTWSVIEHARFRARDYTQAWPAYFREDAAGWYANAKGRRVGNFSVFVPTDSSRASAQIQSPKADGLPGIVIEDDDADGTLDSILVTDSAYRYFCLADENGDGVFDSHEYATGIDPDSKTFHDEDMDGQYDLRVGPGRTRAVAIDSQWYDLIHKDNNQYVELEGTLTQVKAVDGVWRIFQDE